MSISAHRWAKGSSWWASNWQQNTNSLIQFLSTKDTYTSRSIIFYTKAWARLERQRIIHKIGVLILFKILLCQGLQLPRALQQCGPSPRSWRRGNMWEGCSITDFPTTASLLFNWKFSVQCHIHRSYFQLTYSIQWGILNQHYFLPPSFWWVHFTLEKCTLNTCVCYDPI